MRKSWLSRAIFATVSATVLAACTALTGASDLVVGASTQGDTAEASAPAVTTPPSPDAGVLGSVDATVVDACSGTTSCELLPDGFQLVALGSPTAACPPGFGQQPFDAVEQPSLDPGACTCGPCNVTQPPSCRLDSNTIVLLYGPFNGGACPSTGQQVPTGTPCSTGGFLGPFIAYDRHYVAPLAALTGGACSANTVKNDTKLKTVGVRMCQATVLPQCEGKTCVPDVTPFASCVATSGAQACPPAWPQRHLIGASASFTCGTGCTCAVGGQCSTAGTLSYFASTNCSGGAGLIYPVDNGCNPTGGSSTSYGSHRYDPNPPSNVACQSGGSSSPTNPTLAQETTICCK